MSNLRSHFRVENVRQHLEFIFGCNGFVFVDMCICVSPAVLLVFHFLSATCSRFFHNVLIAFQGKRTRHGRQGRWLRKSNRKRTKLSQLWLSRFSSTLSTVNSSPLTNIVAVIFFSSLFCRYHWHAQSIAVFVKCVTTHFLKHFRRRRHLCFSQCTRHGHFCLYLMRASLYLVVCRSHKAFGIRIFLIYFIVYNYARASFSLVVRAS